MSSSIKHADILIVGSNPSMASPNTSPFHHSTKSYKNLITILKEAYPECAGTTFTNVHHLPTKDNRPLTTKEIKDCLPSLKSNIGINIEIWGTGNTKIVAVGQTAQKAMTLLGMEHFALPHTSGLNRQWNDKDFKEQKIKELRNFLLSSK